MRPNFLTKTPDTNNATGLWDYFHSTGKNFHNKTSNLVLAYTVSGSNYLILELFVTGHSNTSYNKLAALTVIADIWQRTGKYPGHDELTEDEKAKVKDRAKILFPDVNVIAKKKKTIVKESKFLTFKQWLCSKL